MSKNPAPVIESKLTYVAKDRIWKNHIEKMEYAAKKWPENWGFLTGRIENLVLSEEEKLKLPKITREPEKIQNFKPVPRTASAWIGWRSTDDKCRLEKYGPYTKGRGSILKSLNWPSEAVG